MPVTDIGQTDYGNMTSTVTDYSVDAIATDGATGDKETTYVNDKWNQQLGYYKKIPELHAAIDAKARWVIGKGYNAEPVTKLALMEIRGHGRDNFNSILANLYRTAEIGGDSYAEIIREGEKLINLKPLDPSTITIVANAQGLIVEYRQKGKTKGQKELKFKPENIFHLSRNRTADEIHGISLIESVEEIIKMRNEALADYKQVMHRYVKPRIVFKVDTDDSAEIAAFKAKADEAAEYGENLFIPKDAVEHELLAVPGNATMSPLAWIKELTNYFYQAAGVPQIIVGGSAEFTEATAKIAYLTFEQTVEEGQLYVEEQVLAQLNLEINLEFPASLQNELLSSKAKSETMQAATTEDVALTRGMSA